MKKYNYSHMSVLKSISGCWNHTQQAEIHEMNRGAGNLVREAYPIPCLWAEYPNQALGKRPM